LSVDYANAMRMVEDGIVDILTEMAQGLPKHLQGTPLQMSIAQLKRRIDMDLSVMTKMRATMD